MDDRSLKRNVMDALEFDPSIQAQNIGVVVDGGVVTLTGHVASYAEKKAAERAVQQVRGVKAIAEEIQVRYPFEKQTADDQIAHRALSIISWDTQIPEGAVHVKVEHGVLTLSGEVRWFYQIVAADAAVRRLSGVTAVVNLIKIAPHANNYDVKSKILEALKRNALVDSEAIHVIVEDDKVRLEGEVKAWYQRNIVETAAWSMPGVMEVEDNLRLASI